MQRSSAAISIQKQGRKIPVLLPSRSSHSMATTCCYDGARCPHAGRNSKAHGMRWFLYGLPLGKWDQQAARLKQLKRSETSRRAAARRCHDARRRPQEAERSRTRCEWLSLGIVVAGRPVVQKDVRCMTSCFCPLEKETI